MKAPGFAGGCLLTITNKYGLKRSIPEETKRAIRTACGFGCVCCGLAIASYEHIDPEFCEASEHDQEKMAYLCEGCHSRVTRKFWSKDRIKKARQNPWCVTNNKCHDAFDIGSSTELKIIIGTNHIINIHEIFKVDETVLLAIEPPESDGGPFRLSGEFYDEMGRNIFRICRNEWIGNSQNWDIECVGGRIIIRTGQNNIALQLLSQPPFGITIEKMNMNYRGTSYFADEGFLKVSSHDGGTIIISGREIRAADGHCVAFTSVSEGNRHKPADGGAIVVGNDGALRIGDGGGGFTMGALPKPASFPRTLKGQLMEKHWGQIRFIVPPKKKNIGANEKCPCNSGLKFKKCCGR